MILLLGPRQVGKTTLVREIAETSGQPYLYLNGDNANVPELLRDRNAVSLKQVLGSNQLVILDEAQNIDEVGLKLKLLIDSYPEVQLLVTGSSSLDLSHGVNESLTGRKYEYNMYPVAYAELVSDMGLLDARATLERRLIYGSYPEVINYPDEQEEVLLTLSSSYLYKDLLNLQDIRRVDLLRKILQAIAFQVGSEVSYTELGRTVQADNQTVERYIDLLEQAFIIFRLPSLSRNLRNEIKRGRKIYFWDNGIRNALISNFIPFSLRQDKGALWENFLVSERQKRNHYSRYFANSYFWRTHAQKEIDYVEERNGMLTAFEFKWSPKKRMSIPATFSKAYPNSTFEVITNENFLPFVTAAQS